MTDVQRLREAAEKAMRLADFIPYSNAATSWRLADIRKVLRDALKEGDGANG